MYYAYRRDTSIPSLGRKSDFWLCVGSGAGIAARDGGYASKMLTIPVCALYLKCIFAGIGVTRAGLDRRHPWRQGGQHPEASKDAGAPGSCLQLECTFGDNSCENRFRSITACSNPWLVNLSVRLFSVTVRTTLSGAPSGISASTSSVILTLAPTRPARCAITSSAIWLASRPTRPLSEDHCAVEALWLCRRSACGCAVTRRVTAACNRAPICNRATARSRAPICGCAVACISANCSLSAFCFDLAHGNVWLDEHARCIGVHQDGPAAHRARHDSDLCVVVAVGVGEGVLLPGEQGDAVADGGEQHAGIGQARQVEVAREVLDELLDGDMVAAPERHAVEFHAQASGGKAGEQQLVGAQLLAARARPARPGPKGGAPAR